MDSVTSIVDKIHTNYGKIRVCDEAYFNQSVPLLSDAEYDSLVQETKDLLERVKIVEPDNEILSDLEEWIDGAGATPSYGKTVKHPSIMGSLEKVNTPEDLFKFLGKAGVGIHKVFLTHKIDGCATRLLYKNGKLKQAATRGNGTEGFDITDNVKYIASIPKEIEYLGNLELRGEIYMKKSVWKKSVEEASGRVFANPRNAASGLIQNKDPQNTGAYQLDFFVYGVVADGAVFKKEHDKADFVRLQLKGFSYVPLIELVIETAGPFLTSSSIKDISAELKLDEEKRGLLDYNIDGLVFGFDDIDLQESFGWRGKYPLGKMAYKFRPEQAVSVVKSVAWQTGRTGRVTPVTEIEPTLLDGSTISRVTLHNWGRIKELKLCIGDKVVIEKSGDVIPAIVSVKESVELAKRVEALYMCPSCGTKLELSNNINLYCYNTACPSKAEDRILHFLRVLDIKGIGDKLIASMRNAGMLNDIPDLYCLNVNKLSELTGGTKSAQNAIDAILEKGEIPLDIFLASLGVSDLGIVTAKELAKEYKTLDNVMVQTATALCKIKGIGFTVAEKIVNGLKGMQPMIERMKQYVDILEVKEKEGILKGMSFCFTGAMSKPRKELENLVEQNGGSAKSSVAKGLTYLVIADQSSTSNKAEKARKLGTQCISEEDFLKMVNL